jgi:hypothetical protein
MNIKITAESVSSMYHVRTYFRFDFRFMDSCIVFYIYIYIHTHTHTHTHTQNHKQYETLVS